MDAGYDSVGDEDLVRGANVTVNITEQLAARYAHKIKTPTEILDLIGHRPRDKIAIMCHGTFDVVHPGHVRHLLYAKGKGEILIASLTCDAHVMKGHSGPRPYVPEELRAINLAALEMVNYVIIDREVTPISNINVIKPDFFAKGFEYTERGLPEKTREEKDVVEAYGGEMIFTPGDIIYSSTSLLNLSAPSIAGEKLAVMMQAEQLGFDDLRAALDAFDGKRVHVVGDTIVDTYTHCSLIGSNAKTPTFSVRYENSQDYVGGAGIVSRHIAEAGADVVFSTVLGDDSMGQMVIDELTTANVLCNAIVDKTRPTTNKNAFIADGYRMLKVDTLDNSTISERVLSELCNSVKTTATDAIIFSDFRHGIFNKATIPTLKSAIPEETFRVADSQVASRWGNILDFSEFDLITPNEKEARFALGDQESGVRPLALSLFEEAKAGTLILKLGGRGVITYRSNRSGDFRAFFAIDSFTDQLVDAVGAGDALLAYSTLAMLATGNEVIASVLGSFAASVECERDGNIPVSRDDLCKKIDAIEGNIAAL